MAVFGFITILLIEKCAGFSYDNKNLQEVQVISMISSYFLNELSVVNKPQCGREYNQKSPYEYNVELSSMCKKGVPLFEAIDTKMRAISLCH